MEIKISKSEDNWILYDKLEYGAVFRFAPPSGSYLFIKAGTDKMFNNMAIRLSDGEAVSDFCDNDLVLPVVGAFVVTDQIEENKTRKSRKRPALKTKRRRKKV